MSTIDLNRRGLFKAGAVIAAASTISGIPVVTQAAEEPEKKIRPLTGKNLKMKDVLDRAREMMMPRCYVCAECNGRGPCIGQVPGFGGMGAYRSFQANYDALAAIRLNGRVVHGVHVPDTSFNFFGNKLSMPVMAAPTGGTTYNMGGHLTEAEFVTAICGGCTAAGTLGAVADGIGAPLNVFEERLQTLKSKGFKAIVGLKPRRQQDIIERMKIAANAGGLTGDLILKAIAHERHIDDMASWLEMEGQHRAASLKANLGILSVIVTLAPLMGLLGTVLGMIRSFDVLNVANGEPFAITGGVAEALTATAFGLFVAILALICWACLNQRAERLVGELERGAGLYLVSRKKGEASEVPAEPASQPATADIQSPISQASRITAAQTASGAFSS